MESNPILFVVVCFLWVEWDLRFHFIVHSRNYEINETLKRLTREVRNVRDKLNRHEVREANLAAFSTKTLNALTADHATAKENLDTVGRQLSSLEEKMLSIQALISTVKFQFLLENQSRVLKKAKQSASAGPRPSPSRPRTANWKITTEKAH